MIAQARRKGRRTRRAGPGRLVRPFAVHTHAVHRGGLCRGQVAAWNLDEQAGKTWTDLTGNGHTLTPAGSPADADGPFGRARSFDGSSDYAVASNSAGDFDIGDDDFTVACWFNKPAAGDSDYLLGTGTGWRAGKTGWAVYVGTNNEIGVPMENASAVFNNPTTANGTVTDDTWQSLVIVFDQTLDDVVCYVDGAAVEFTSGTNNIPTALTSASDFHIGMADDATTQRWQGSIAHVICARRVWTVNDALRFHNHGVYPF